MSNVIVKYVHDYSGIDLILGKIAVGKAVSGESAITDLGLDLEDVEKDADPCFIQFETEWNTPINEYVLNLAVYQERNECYNEIYTRTLTKDDIEYTIDREYGEDAEFIGYTDVVPKFKYGKHENVSVNWAGNDVDIFASESVIESVRVYFKVKNSDDEEDELSIEIDTNFPY